MVHHPGNSSEKMATVKAYHSVPKELHAVLPRVAPKFSTRQCPGEKPKPPPKSDYYMGPPWRLMLDDAKLFFEHAPYLGNICTPLWLEGDVKFASGSLAEFYPSSGNIWAMTLHLFLIIAQSSFLFSLLFVSYFPFPVFLAYICIFILVNQLACWKINGSFSGMGTLESTRFPECRHWKDHSDERWIFLNGVSVGKHWLQNSIDRISLTFHRKVEGVHNKTSGIIFDVIQCLLERCFYFGTSDTRACFSLISEALRTSNQKVVLILHSQGGLEGSIILDWLMNQHSQETMRRLEIYTFGNAANHFSNPRKHEADEKRPRGGDKRAVGHIEHYANSLDFVARWGVTHFKKALASRNNIVGGGGGEYEDDQGRGATVYLKKAKAAAGLDAPRPCSESNQVEKDWNSYHGTLIEREGSGHMLNQHYFDTMFPLDKFRSGAEVDSHGNPLPGSFMDMEVEEVNDHQEMDNKRGRKSHENHGHAVGSGGKEVCKTKVYQISRLWGYTNGNCPPPRKG